MLWNMVMQVCDPLVEQCGESTGITLVSFGAQSSGLNDWLLLVLLVVILLVGVMLLDAYLELRWWRRQNGKVLSDKSNDSTDGN